MAFKSYLNGEFLTTKQLAEWIAVDHRTLEGWRLAGKGPPYIRPGGGSSSRVLYRRADVEVWLRKRTHKSAASEKTQLEKTTIVERRCDLAHASKTTIPLDADKHASPVDLNEKGSMAIQLSRRLTGMLTEKYERFERRLVGKQNTQEPGFLEQATPAADVRKAFDPDQFNRLLIDALRAAGLHESVLYATERMGRALMADGCLRDPRAAREEWNAAVAEYYRSKGLDSGAS